jgi:hypothetical protein
MECGIGLVDPAGGGHPDPLSPQRRNHCSDLGFQSFNTACRTIAGSEAMLWLRKGFGFAGDWTVDDQNDLLARFFGLQKVNKA